MPSSIDTSAMRPETRSPTSPAVLIRASFFILLSLAPFSSASPKVALLVGVSDYDYEPDLCCLVGLEKLNTLSTVLKARSFSVTVLMNPTAQQFRSKLTEFANTVAHHAVLFISGRGYDENLGGGPPVSRIYLKDATPRGEPGRSGYYPADDLINVVEDGGAVHMWVFVHGCDCVTLRRRGSVARRTSNLPEQVAAVVNRTSSLAVGTLTRKRTENDGSALATSLASALEGGTVGKLCGPELFGQLRHDLQNGPGIFRGSKWMAKDACI